MTRNFTNTVFIGLTLLIFSNCKKGSEDVANNSLNNNYESYIEQVNKNTSSLSSERKKKREEWINELKKNAVYITLVGSKNVDEKYLPTLNAVSEAIKNTYLEDGVSLFGISDNIANDLENSPDGKTKMDFVIKVASLSMKMNGGMPKEIIQVFENYRKEFNLFGKKGDVVIDTSGNKKKIQQPYNLSYAFALFDPTEKKVLDAIFESVKTGVSQWNEENNVVYDNGFMSLKHEYMKQLKEVYPESKYLINVDFEISPENLYASYEANEVAADEKYKNKKLAITGSISDIGKDMTDQPFISFKIDYLQSVTCYFPKKESSKISKLNKGDVITILGECRGLVITNIVIKECEVSPD